jgi:hypothetical protein
MQFSPLSCYLLDPDMLLSTLFSSNLKLCNVRIHNADTKLHSISISYWNQKKPSEHLT